MAQISPEQAGGHNRVAFLDMIAFSEGTSTSPITEDDGYDIIVTGLKGPNRFTDFSTHPNVIVKVNRNGLYSTAAGRYQLLYRYWLSYKRLLNLTDFGPISQDRIALQQITEKGAMSAIDAGYLQKAITLCSSIWASFPGGQYGQPQQPLDILEGVYQKAGGKA
jgi:muramidase (phage lysozyme)